jgi:hypothetical protein
MDDTESDLTPTDLEFAAPPHHVRKTRRPVRPLLPAPPEPGAPFPMTPGGVTLRTLLIWVLAVGSFVVFGSTSSHGTRVFPIGAVTAAPLCWFVLWINRRRLGRTDHAAGLVALCGVAYGVLEMIIA